jgi:hypothetical protein
MKSFLTLIVRLFYLLQSNSVYDASFVSNPVVFGFTTSTFVTAETACSGSSESTEDDSTGNDLLDRIIEDFNRIAK